jgi:toxin ParE1/3/4
MAYRVDVTERTILHLRQIYSRINATDSVQARRWFDGLKTAILSLEDYPNRCPESPEDSTLRHHLYGSKPHTYRIIFEIDEPHSLVRFMSIRHGASKPFARSEVGARQNLPGPGAR